MMNDLNVAKRMARMMKPLMATEIKAAACGSAQHLCASTGLVTAVLALFSYASSGNDAMTRAYAAAAAVMILLRGFLAYGEQLFNHDMAFTVLRDIRMRAFDAMRELAPTAMRGKGRGNLVSVLMQDIELLEIFYAHTLSPMVIAAITALIGSAVIATLSPWLAIAALVLYAVIDAIIPLALAPLAQGPSMQARDMQGEAHSLILESVDGRSTLDFFEALGATESRLDAATRRLTHACAVSRRAIERNAEISRTAALAAIGAFGILSYALASRGVIATGAAAAAFAGFVASLPAFVSVSRLGTYIQPTFAAARRIFAILDEKPTVPDNENGELIDDFHEAVMTDVSFAYTPDAPVLRAANMTVVSGRVIAISGPNGAGKSTLIDMLMRFRDCDDGRISFNGIPIRRIRTSALRSVETLASQDTYIFSSSLRDNIAVANRQASSERIQEACETADLGDVVARWPDGLDHVLQENGRELSDGEKQRIAIARVLASGARLVLFDEPTSNMDALLEGRIMHALIEKQNGRTYVIVSHRKAILQYCDEIYTLTGAGLSRQTFGPDDDIRHG